MKKKKKTEKVKRSDVGICKVLIAITEKNKRKRTERNSRTCQ